MMARFQFLPWISEHLQLLGIGLAGAATYWGVHSRSKKQNQAKKILKRALNRGLDQPFSLHPEIDPAKCAGCGACTKACPEGDILSLVNHKAVLTQPTQCVGHGECARACPFDAIELVFGTKKRGVDLPHVNQHYETNRKGVYIAGELGGMGLIRNAVKQGAAAAEHSIQNLKNKNAKSDCDVLIVGAGPAGIAAALQCIASGVKYQLIDQDTFGGSVAHFPRQKLVMLKTAVLPLVGEMKFPTEKVSKEQLLEFWKRVRAKTGLKIKERIKFESLQERDGQFVAQTSQGEITTQKVILCMGLRGTPRKLNLEHENSPKVLYQLSDAREFQGQKIVVVGDGNVGVETAMSLSATPLKNTVTLLSRNKSFERANQENQTKIMRRSKEKKLNIRWSSQVEDLDPHYVYIKPVQEASSMSSEKIPYDYLFVCIGAELPNGFLKSLGINIATSFGDVKRNPV